MLVATLLHVQRSTTMEESYLLQDPMTMMMLVATLLHVQIMPLRLVLTIGVTLDPFSPIMVIVSMHGHQAVLSIPPYLRMDHIQRFQEHRWRRRLWLEWWDNY